MDGKKLVLLAVVAVAIYFVVVDPTAAAAAVRALGGHLEDAATVVITFFKGIIGTP